MSLFKCTSSSSKIWSMDSCSDSLQQLLARLDPCALSSCDPTTILRCTVGKLHSQLLRTSCNIALQLWNIKYRSSTTQIHCLIRIWNLRSSLYCCISVLPFSIGNILSREVSAYKFYRQINKIPVQYLCNCLINGIACGQHAIIFLSVDQGYE